MTAAFYFLWDKYSYIIFWNWEINWYDFVWFTFCFFYSFCEHATNYDFLTMKLFNYVKSFILEQFRCYRLLLIIDNFGVKKLNTIIHSNLPRFCLFLYFITILREKKNMWKKWELLPYIPGKSLYVSSRTSH